ncbi:MAG TPA: MBL fold metallo-hydrolase, partial [Bacteroidia bacterium]|nr:MBL fold metallo-hydrolase [Bacteroidia bacterium]
MKDFVYTFILFFSLSNLFAQRPAADQIKTSKGPISIQPILHASLVLTWNNKTIYIDPYGGAKAYAGLAAPDLILITDIHPDHLNPETLKIIETSKATFIVPQAVADQLPDNLKSKAVV